MELKNTLLMVKFSWNPKSHKFRRKNERKEEEEEGSFKLLNET